MQVFIAPGDEMVHHFAHFMTVRPGSLDRLLGFAQFGGRDQLHGLGHLLGVLGTLDSLFDVS
jgi:hypothetical protein